LARTVDDEGPLIMAPYPSRFLRPALIGVLAFAAAILAAASFEMIPFFLLSLEFWILAATLAFLSAWATYYFKAPSVFASLSIAFLSAYFARKMSLAAVHPFILVIFLAATIGLVLKNERHLLGTVIGALSVFIYIFFIGLSSNTFFHVIHFGTTMSASYLVAVISDRAAEILEPVNTATGVFLAQILSFLGVYVLIASFYALIYHSIYLCDPSQFRISPDLGLGHLDLGYFLYWSFGAFMSAGSSEASPATNLTRTVVVLQVLSGISWLTIFLSLFVSHLTNQMRES
jgi:hypothetical protein